MKTYLKQGRWGQFLLISGDMISEYANILGHWADIEIDLFRALMPAKGARCIEVGANIGLHAVPLSRLCEGGELICYEPQRPIFHVLCANLALNNCLNVRARHAAVGEESGHIDIQSSDYETAWNYGSFSISQGFSTEGEYGGPVKTEKVEITALDLDPALEHLQSLDLLKIDAEGHELSVLKGAERLIADHRPDIFVEPGSGKNADRLKEFMEERGYTGSWFVGRRYGPDDDFTPDAGTQHYDVNIIFRPNGSPALDLPPLRGHQDLDEGIPILMRFG